MVETAETTKFTCYAGGHLHIEDAPWRNDNATHPYSTQLRISLRLQQAEGAWTKGFDYNGEHCLSWPLVGHHFVIAQSSAWREKQGP